MVGDRYGASPGFLGTVTAIQNQNTEVAAGEVGSLPAPRDQLLNATVTAQSRLRTPEQFENIILKTEPSGATVRIKDVTRVAGAVP